MVTTSRSTRPMRNVKEGRTLRNRATQSYQEISENEEEETYHSSSDDIPLASRSTTTRVQHVPAISSSKRNRHGAQDRSSRSKRARRGAQEESDSDTILLEPPSKSLHTPRRTRERKIVKQTKGAKKSPRTVIPKPFDILEAGGNVPDWASLPYHILLMIFEHAIWPSYDKRTYQVPAAYERVLGCSRLCRAFSEPALTALYKCPALVPMSRAFKLVSLLNSNDLKQTYNYRYKIEAIHMEVSQTAMYKLPGYGLLDLHSLLFSVPRLRSLELCHRKDLAPFRELDHNIKWTIPAHLFQALERNIDGVATKLKSWRWNARLSKDIAIEEIVEYHKREYFSSLEKVALCNYQVAKPSRGEATDATDSEHERALAQALLELRHLNHLILESSTLVNSVLMPLLPPVARLEIINCWDVTSEDLLSYMSIHGANLRHLRLDHNISLNLSFLSHLGSLCPHLETLRMDMTYYSVHSSYDNTEPEYDCLLEAGEIPDWPSSIQTIELLHLRRWASEDKAVETAQLFFQSLLDSAERLPDLRYLVVKGTLNIAWRDRASFREKWYEPLHSVFQRVCDPPRVFDATQDSTARDSGRMAASQDAKRLRQSPINGQNGTVLRSSRRGAVTQGIPTPERSGSRASRSLRSRVGTRYREQSTSESDLETENDVDVRDGSAEVISPESMPRAPDLKRRRRTSRELKILKACAGIDSSRTITPLDNGSDPVEAEDMGQAATKQEQFVQGMCHTVDIQIDNLRPAENQYKESDFLDSEPEGDEDYNGQDLEFD